MKSTSASFVWLGCLLFACSLDASKLGDLESSAASESSGSAQASGSSSGASGAPDSGRIGSLCEHNYEDALEEDPTEGEPDPGPPLGVEATLITDDIPGCAGDFCVYSSPGGGPPASQCSDDRDCADESGHYYCDLEESRCLVKPEILEQRSFCSAACEADTDCADADTSGCTSGFVCRQMIALGENCCQKVCVCADDVDVATSQELEAECEAGVAACCELHPEQC